MHVKLIFKFLLLFKLLITVGCSYNRLENLGLLKEKANEYSLARKAPLIMPPDMYLRPPSSEKEVTISNDNIEDDISLDDILVGNGSTKNQRNNKRIIKSVNNEAKILKKILDKKAVILLK